MSKVVCKYDDEITDVDFAKIAFDDKTTSILVDHNEGVFSISIFDSVNKIMRYFNIIDGFPVLTGIEDLSR